MNIRELRTQIDGVDAQLIRLLEDRMDIAADIAVWKQRNNIPVMDSVRESEKLSSVRGQCRPETAALIAGIFSDIMAASRTYQEKLMEAEHAK